jgi:nucleoid DNA-binding protein
MVRVTGCRLAKEVARDMELPSSVCQEVVHMFIYKCLHHLAEGDEVVIEGLGRLLAKKERHKGVVTDKNGKKHARSASVRVRFRRSPILGRIVRERMLTPEERGQSKEK